MWYYGIFFFRLKEQIYFQNSPKIAYLCSSWLRHSCQYPSWNEHCCFLLLILFFLLMIMGEEKKRGGWKTFSFVVIITITENWADQKTCLKLLVRISEEHVTEVDIFRHLKINSQLRFSKMDWQIKLMISKGSQINAELLIFTETVFDFDSYSEFKRNSNTFALNIRSIISILDDREY